MIPAPTGFRPRPRFSAAAEEFGDPMNQDLENKDYLKKTSIKIFRMIRKILLMDQLVF